MIVFVGNKEKGFFCEDIAKKDEMEVAYVAENLHIENQINNILRYREECKYLVFQIEQYVDDSEEIINTILKIKTAINAKIIIYAVGYTGSSKVVLELFNKGIKNFIFGMFLADQKEDLERCISGYYESFGYESRGIVFSAEEESEEEIIATEKSKQTIGVAGSIARMGTTTQALQIVKYLLFKGHSAAYIEMNNHGFVKQLKDNYSDAKNDENLGKITFQGVDMFYRQDKLSKVLGQDYEYFIYDYGVVGENGFNKVSFLEKKTQIFVVGSKPSEFDKTYDVIKNNFYNDVNYIFNFVPKSEHKDLLELMGEKQNKTFFSDITCDPFTLGDMEIYKSIIPVEDLTEEKKTKKGFWKGRVAYGKKSK